MGVVIFVAFFSVFVAANIREVASKGSRQLVVRRRRTAGAAWRGLGMVVFMMFLLSIGRGNLISEQGVRERMSMPFMAGEAAHCGMTFEVMIIDGGDHFYHLAG
jgi:hypothetical protein